MLFPENIFTERQFMLNPDFELYHYKNIGEFKVELHHHDFYEIFIFISGDVEYFIEGVTYKLMPDDILLINCQQLHKPEVGPNTPYERIVLFIRPEFIMSRNTEFANLVRCFESNDKARNYLVHPDSVMMNTINEVLTKIFTLLNSKEFGSDILKELYISEFLVYINQCFLKGPQQRESAKIQNQLIEKIIWIINNNIENELSLDTIADKLYVSKYYLAHYFKLSTGVPLHRFITYKRLLIANSLLKTGSSVKYACQKSGFGDYNNFIRSFKKLYGLSPKKFVKTSIRSNSIIE